MKSATFLIRAIVALGITAAFAGPALAQGPEPQNPSPPDQPMSAKAEQPQGGDPGAMLEQARDSVQRQDLSQATRQMQAAAKAIRSEAENAPAEARTGLNDAAMQLDDIAKQASTGEQIDAQAADEALAQAAHALAAYHQVAAQEALRSNDRAGVRRHLEAGAKDLGRAAKFTGRESERGVRDVVGDALEVSGTIGEGAGAIPKEAGRAVEGLGRGIDRVGRDIHAKRSSKQQPAQG